MKSLRLILFFVFCLIHCNKLDTISLQIKDFISGDLVGYSFDIPRGYHTIVEEVPDMHWGNLYSYQYQYNNGGLLYFGNYPRADIGVIEQFLGEKRGFNYLVGNELFLDSDLATAMGIPDYWDLKGKGGKNKYWRDVECFSWTIGYKGVPERYLSIFDAIIDTFVQEYKNIQCEGVNAN